MICWVLRDGTGACVPKALELHCIKALVAPFSVNAMSESVMNEFVDQLDPIRSMPRDGGDSDMVFD